MPEKSLHDLFLEELKDMYDAEKRLTRAIPKMAKAASAPELQTALTDHLGETEKQIARLEQVFRGLGERPSGKACDGIMGIIEEGKKAMEELEEGPVLDAALIAGAQKAEHYEIASYGTLAHFAAIMGHDEAKNLLGQTLDEEKAADEKLNTIAMSKVNRQALRGAHHESREARGLLAAARGGVRRAGAAIGLANERAPRPRAASSRSRTTRTGAGRRSAARGSKKR